eukprot:GHVO01023546.1.p1 GENE.GHVO01023546.1~~GHVO01023546.1.p1  ORF type:complete len:242 (+),score=33.43 GHVO01023546.1:327-1052(+)
MQDRNGMSECFDMGDDSQSLSSTVTSSFTRAETHHSCVAVCDDYNEGGYRDQPDGAPRSKMVFECETEMVADVAIFKWDINNFTWLRKRAKQACHINDASLSSSTYIDCTGSEWWLRLYPYETRGEHRGKVSLFLHTRRPLKGDVMFNFKYGIVDSHDRSISSMEGRINDTRLSTSTETRNIGVYELIASEERIQDCIGTNDVLRLRCEVEILSNPLSIDKTDDPHECTLCERHCGIHHRV